MDPHRDFSFGPSHPLLVLPPLSRSLPKSSVSPMASCVTTPRQTVFSTPVDVQTITNMVTRTVTIPGAEVTQTFYYTQCIEDNFGGHFRRLKRQVECPNGTTVSTSYSVSTCECSACQAIFYPLVRGGPTVGLTLGVLFSLPCVGVLFHSSPGLWYDRRT